MITACEANGQVKRSLQFEQVKQAAHGKIDQVLAALGLSSELLNAHNDECPKCRNDDSFTCRDRDVGGFLCHKCKATGLGDIFDFVGWIRPDLDRRGRLQFVADAIGYEPKLKRVTSKANESAEFKKWFSPLSPIPSLFQQFIKSKSQVTFDGLRRAGANYGTAQFHPAMDTKQVIAVPVYSAETLEQIDYACYSRDGSPLPVGNGQTAKIRLLHGRDGLMMSQWARSVLLKKEPVERPRAIKGEGCSDLLALLSAIDETKEKILCFTQSAGACALETSIGMLNYLEAISPEAIFCIGDCDLAGQAGLIGGETAQGSFEFGYANVIANACPDATFNVQLPYEIADKKGKDLRDFLDDGHGIAEIFSLPMEQVEPVDRDVATKKLTKSDTKADRGAGRGKVSSTIENFIDEDDRIKAIPIGEIADRIFKVMNGFPKIHNGQLFHFDSKRIHYLKKTPAFFSLLREVASVNWRAGANLATRDEIFEVIMRRAEVVSGIQHDPHWPANRAGILYTCGHIEPTNAGYLEDFIDRFSLATHDDKELFKAFVITTFWDGPPGQRPVFLFSADGYGQGAGKTTSVNLVARLTGGSIEIGVKEDGEKIKARILSPGASTKRLISMDNAKASVLSNADIEAMVTCTDISGKALYVGESSVPNLFTWCITMNGPSLSRDLAQRSVNIQIARPKHSGHWLDEITAFIDRHREKIISDVGGFFQRAPIELERYNRWGKWQREILSRLPNAERIASLVVERELTNDNDSRTAKAITSTFSDNLKRLGYGAAGPCSVHIPMSIIANWISDALGEQYKPNGAGRLLSRLIDCRLLPNVDRNGSNTYGKGFIWRIDGHTGDASYDLPDLYRSELQKIIQENCSECGGTGIWYPFGDPARARPCRKCQF